MIAGKSPLFAGFVGLWLVGFANAQGVISVTTVDPTCPLDCKEDGQCVRGNADFSAFNTTENAMPFLRGANQNGYYCQCPPGRTGLLCEREYESCGDGMQYCFHGGKCLTGVKDAFGNARKYCDCGGADYDGVSYAGKFCEAEAVDVCGEGAEYGKIFCTNGGKCKENFLDFIDQPCVCPNGFEGLHCEYQAGESPDFCDLPCENGGRCQIGTKDYPPNELYNEFWKTHDDYRFCVCPPGFFGLTCSVQGEPCGDGHCFNGGSCLSQELSDGTTREFCDCTTADGAYAGLFCESESTTFCTNIADNNGRQFCVNGGSCKADSHLGCDCLEGFNGPICEFRDSVVQNKECNLKCENMGVCRNGAKEVGFLKKFNRDMPNVDLAYSDDFEHCVCPKGYVGLQCEHMVEVCPGGEHICMNGAECVPDDSDGRLRYKCDCDTIRLPFDKYTGEFCELKSTELCTFNGRPGTGLNKDAFCVNGGKCVHHVGEQEEHPGCKCPVGFEGLHCESLSGERGAPDVEVIDEKEGDDRLSTVGIIFIVLFIDIVVLGAIGAYVYFRRKRNQKDFDNEYPNNLMGREDAPEPPSLGEVLAMNSLADNSERSSLHDSSQRSSYSSSVNGDGIFKVEDEGKDLVNVAII